MLRHNIKLNNKYDFKLTFRQNKLYRVQYVDSINSIYILKELNEIRLEKIYVNNKLKRFKIKKNKNASTKLVNI